ncbi:hypothetical protein GE09DRAFT_88156 [Coniochaeta sp. 2T2.1]|nr:hypothetical protein GE09DRAFT_88156 [Coniochaeta sp. 2T2.1]
MSRSNDQLQRTLSKTFTPTVETFTRRQCNNLEHNVAVLLEGDEKQAAYRSTTSSRRRKAKWLLTQAVETLDSVRFVIFSTLSPKTLGEITDTEKREFVGQLKGTIEALSVSAALENKAIAWFEKHKAKLLEAGSSSRFCLTKVNAKPRLAGLNLRDKATDDDPPSTRQPIPLVNRRERLDTEWPRHGDGRDGGDIDSHGDPASTASAHKRKRTGGPEPRGLGGECGPPSGQTSTEDEIKSLLQRLGELPITNPRKQQLVEQVKEGKIGRFSSHRRMLSPGSQYSNSKTTSAMTIAERHK